MKRLMFAVIVGLPIVDVVVWRYAYAHAVPIIGHPSYQIIDANVAVAATNVAITVVWWVGIIACVLLQDWVWRRSYG